MASIPDTERHLRADARRNRERIVQAARQIVAEQGAAAQIDDVARKAGVGVGTVYRHFPTKEALMGALLRQCIEENTELVRAQADVEDPWEGFAGMVRGVCKAMATDAAKRRMWAAASAEAFEMAHDAKAELERAAAHVIDRAHDAGVLRAEFGIDDIGMLMCGLGAAMDVRGENDWTRMVEFALDGLRARPPS
jgi:AcrR family transcriptional regulator